MFAWTRLILCSSIVKKPNISDHEEHEATEQNGTSDDECTEQFDFHPNQKILPTVFVFQYEWKTFRKLLKIAGTVVISRFIHLFVYTASSCLPCSSP